MEIVWKRQLSTSLDQSLTSRFQCLNLTLNHAIALRAINTEHEHEYSQIQHTYLSPWLAL